VTDLLDTDHISILQRQAGPEFPTLQAHIAQQEPIELALSIISMHAQVLGCHTSSSCLYRQRGGAGYRMLA
jgi:tRNA(fMet)-specific endonuclease VapC